MTDSVPHGRLPDVSSLLDDRGDLFCPQATRDRVLTVLENLRTRLEEVTDPTEPLGLISVTDINLHGAFEASVMQDGVEDTSSFEEDMAVCMDIATELVTRRTQILLAQRN